MANGESWFHVGVPDAKNGYPLEDESANGDPETPSIKTVVLASAGENGTEGIDEIVLATVEILKLVM